MEVAAPHTHQAKTEETTDLMIAHLAEIASRTLFLILIRVTFWFHFKVTNPLYYFLVMNILLPTMAVTVSAMQVVTATADHTHPEITRLMAQDTVEVPPLLPMAVVILTVEVAHTEAPALMVVATLMVAARTAAVLMAAVVTE